MRCPVHRVAHTGKLARSVVLDLALFDLTDDARHWERAVARAEWVAGRLAPDPEHGALIYHPGRLDPRNCSTSAIDSGECTDALARLLRHSRAGQLDRELDLRLRAAVERNAETYLQKAVLEKGITNQRLWAAMGLTSAWALLDRDAWLEPLQRSVALALAEQRQDGSWGYQPNAAAEGAHPGAADLTVYYHSRCVAFLQHIAAHVPALDTDRVRDGISRGLDFLALVTTPDGLKPLTLEGKRWFWDGTYEAGSAAYDVFALLHGAETLARDDLRVIAAAAWAQLARHQRSDGAIVACLEPGNADFVCPDFHTADLAWAAQVISDLGSPRQAGFAEGVRRADDAGVIREDGGGRTALLRTSKQPANSQFGGAVGGGALAALVGADGTRRLLPREGRCTVYPVVSLSGSLAGLRRFLRENRPRREGSQLLFVVRLLARQRRYAAAARRLWRGWFGPMLESLRDPASPDWATVGQRVSRADGSVPRWAASLTVDRQCALEPDGARVTLALSGDAPRVRRIDYVIPAAAWDVQVHGEGLDVRRQGREGRRVIARSTGAPLRLDVTYRL